MKVKSESEVAQSCPTLSDPVDCSLPGSSVLLLLLLLRGIFQARVLEWGALAFSGQADLLCDYGVVCCNCQLCELGDFRGQYYERKIISTH